MREGKKVIAGEGENGPTAGLYTRDRDEIHYAEAAECEENCGSTAHAIEEELCNLVIDNVSFGEVRTWNLGLGKLTGWPLGLFIRSLGSPMQTTKTRLKKNPMT